MEIVLYNYSIEDNGIQIISVAVFDNFNARDLQISCTQAAMRD